MGAEPLRDLTLILGRARAGDERARGELITLVYDELRQVAARLMRRERQDHTLPPTAVVHEAVIRLLGDAVFDKSPDRSSCSRRPRGPCGRSLSTTRGEGPPTGAAGAGGECRSTSWWTTSKSRDWISSRSTRPSTDWPS